MCDRLSGTFCGVPVTVAPATAKLPQTGRALGPNHWAGLTTPLSLMRDASTQNVT